MASLPFMSQKILWKCEKVFSKSSFQIKKCLKRLKLSHSCCRLSLTETVGQRWKRSIMLWRRDIKALIKSPSGMKMFILSKAGVFSLIFVAGQLFVLLLHISLPPLINGVLWPRLYILLLEPLTYLGLRWFSCEESWDAAMEGGGQRGKADQMTPFPPLKYRSGPETQSCIVTWHHHPTQPFPPVPPTP